MPFGDIGLLGRKRRKGTKRGLMRETAQQRKREEEYALDIRKCLAVSLAIIVVLLLILPKEFKTRPYQLRKEVATIMEELPPELLKQKEEPLPVEKPKLPKPVETEKEAEAKTIVPTSEIPEFIEKKPENVEVPIVPFWVVEKKPVVKYVPKPKYPELARQAGAEGTVIVEVLVDVDGTVKQAKIVKSSKFSALDQAALEAAKQATFIPAEQRDRKVRVWVAIPFNFTLER